MGTIGNTGIIRPDAVDKALGLTKYAGDMYFPDMLYAKPLFSKYPRARILAIDVSAARAAEGVVAVLTAKDIEGSNYFGASVRHQPVLVPEGGEVKYLGDAIALVAAESEFAARRALSKIKVEYEELPGVYCIDDALAPGAPLVHEDFPDNVCSTSEIVIGDVASSYKSSDVIIEKVISTPRQEHAYLEPEAAVGVMDGNDTITLYSCIQNPTYFTTDVAQAVGIPMNKFKVIATTAGGAFGAKNEITLQAHVTALVKKLKRPVKMVYSREESLISSAKRHPAKFNMKIGARKDGLIQFMEASFYLDAGAYSGKSPATLANCVHSLSGPYCIPNLKLQGTAVYTNNPVSGAQRGMGQPQSCLAREVMIDLLAEKLRIDPVELRRRNILKQGDVVGTPIVNLDTEVSLPAVLDKATEMAGELKRSSDPNILTGRGVSCVMPFFDIANLPVPGFTGAGVSMQLCLDGSIKVYSTAVELGQGITSVLAQIAAEEFGVSLEKVTVVLGDVDTSPSSGPTVASRSTYVHGNALLMAAGSLKSKVLEVAAKTLEEDKESLSFSDGMVVCSSNPSKKIALLELANECYAQGVNLRQDSWFKATHAIIGHTFIVSIADVEVNTVTGEVTVQKLVNVHDIGKAINPMGVIGQLDGGALMSQGWALMEDFATKEGYIQTASLTEYLIPTSKDLPREILSGYIEDYYPTGPYGAKGVGEHATMSAGPAIINAIHNATGIMITELPATPEKLCRSSATLSQLSA